jgi:hypothetical protein
MVAATAIGTIVVAELKPVTFGAAATVVPNEGAPAIVTFVHSTPYRSRDISRRK